MKSVLYEVGWWVEPSLAGEPKAQSHSNQQHTITKGGLLERNPSGSPSPFGLFEWDWSLPLA